MVTLCDSMFATCRKSKMLVAKVSVALKTAWNRLSATPTPNTLLSHHVATWCKFDLFVCLFLLLCTLVNSCGYFKGSDMRWRRQNPYSYTYTEVLVPLSPSLHSVRSTDDCVGLPIVHLGFKPATSLSTFSIPNHSTMGNSPLPSPILDIPTTRIQTWDLPLHRRVLFSWPTE